jgi:predicted phosphodiesterase
VATVEIALRYRDIESSTNAIVEHQNIISEYGEALWGWWKKDFEPSRQLKPKQSAEIFLAYLVNRHTREMFEAEVTHWYPKDLPKGKSHLVPAYYRKETKLVHSWFNIKSIVKCRYDENIANKFGDSTFVDLTDDSVPTASIATVRSARGNVILHLSDLHFGPDYAFELQGAGKKMSNTKRTLTDCILADLKRLKKDQEVSGIVITGDFITAGDWSDNIKNSVLLEMQALCEAFKISKNHLIIIPGNHDIVRYSESAGISAERIALQNQITYKHENDYRIFSEQASGRKWDEPLQHVEIIQLKDVDIVVCKLNSCTILATEWTEYGYVGELGIDALQSVLAVKPMRPYYKVLAIHHHLLPVSDISSLNRNGVTLSIDAAKILDAAQQAGIQVALHGHEHIPRIARYGTVQKTDALSEQQITVISSGSSGVAESRRPGSERNAYGILDFSLKGLTLIQRELRPDLKEGATLFDMPLSIEPIGAS